MSIFRLRPVTREQRQLAMLWAAAVASALVLRPVWIALAPHFRPCTFRRITGIPCPTCGTTRSALAMLDLDFASAFVVNPLAALVGSAFVIGGVLALAWVVFAWPVPSFSLRWNRRWSITLIGIVVANWLYLIATH